MPKVPTSKPRENFFRRDFTVTSAAEMDTVASSIKNLFLQEQGILKQSALYLSLEFRDPGMRVVQRQVSDSGERESEPEGDDS